MPHRRTIAITIGVVSLALLVAVAPFVPRGHHRDGRITPTTTTADDASAYGAVTPGMRAEIDRVVREGLAQPAARARTPEALAARQVRCATFEGLTYCLHLGWVEDSPAQAEARVATAARASYAARKQATPLESTGDLDPLAELDGLAKLTPTARADAERAELTAAARSVAKVWVLRHEIEGVPYPDGFLDRHPEALALTAAAHRAAAARASGSASASPSPSASPSGVKTSRDYPKSDKILDSEQVAEQTLSYWCGPTSMQMIAWGWWDVKRPQKRWARRMGTTSGGTDVYAMASTVNRYTGWDGPKYAGPYVVVDIGKYTYKKWYLLIMRHIHDYRAPIIMHPILLKKYFSYLDDDASGHYQVGRGYAKRGAKPDLVSYFEPWNQQRFDASEPYIERVQWHLAYQSFRANKAHPYHNIGV